MKKTRSSEMIEYRNIIMNEICQSKELVKLLGYEGEEYPETKIPFTCSFPHEYMPDTVTETERFINFDIEAGIDPANNTFRHVTIYFYITCHEAAVRYEEDGQTFLWYDKVTCELDHILCEKNSPGIGKTVLISNKPYCPQNKFKGRLLKFTVKDFSNGFKNGK